MERLEHALDMAAEFVQATWRHVVMRDFECPPGAPELRFDSPDQRAKYADSIVLGGDISIPGSHYYGRLITATEPIAEETEKGKPAWDMKPYLLNYKGNGTKARQSKSGGRYNVIPFRHGTSDNPNSHFPAMPADIYAMARMLKPKQPLRGTEAAYPPQTKHITVDLPNGGLRFMTYRHKSGIYESMYKVEAGYAKVRQSQYLTFRTVSDKSDPASWWHPARAAQPHVQWIIDYCLPKVEKMLAEAAKAEMVDLVRFGVGMSMEYS